MALRTSPVPHSYSGVNVDVGAALLVAFIASLVLWAIPGANLLLLPIHPYLTFVHEGWHALVALLTGGHVGGVHLYGLVGGGVTYTAGGAVLLIASAGYVGSALTGATFLALLGRPFALRLAVAAQYLWLLVVGVLWDHDPNAWAYLLVFGVATFLMATKLPERVFAFAMGFLALQLALAVLGDLRTLLFLSVFTSAHSDALLASSVTHLPALLWALLWSGLAIALMLGALRSALTGPRRARLSA